MTNNESLRNKIQASGISMVFLAKAIGITRKALYNKVNGQSEFKASEIIRISNVLHLTDQERDENFFAN